MNASKPRALVTTILLFAATASPRAFADDHSTEAPIPPIAGPEVTVSAGYARAFSHDGLGGDAAAQGLGAELGLGYRRLTWTLGVVASHAETKTEPSTRFVSSGAGIALTIHLAPASTYSPWIRSGVGYRYVAFGSTSAHGFEVASALVGVDLRLSPLLSLSPAIGIQLDVLPFRGRGSDAERLESLQGMAFAGLLARFDLGPLAY